MDIDLLVPLTLLSMLVWFDCAIGSYRKKRRLLFVVSIANLATMLIILLNLMMGFNPS